jgi:hypothetical protein
MEHVFRCANHALGVPATLWGIEDLRSLDPLPIQHKDLYQNAAPTYVTSVMQQPSSEFLAKNRRKSVSPPGSALRPNTSVETG